jgi:hypothetical protein
MSNTIITITLELSPDDWEIVNRVTNLSTLLKRAAQRKLAELMLQELPTIQEDQ